MYSLILLSYAISIAVLIATPGPITLLVMNSSSHGLKTIIPIILGGVISSLILIFAAFICMSYIQNHDFLGFEIIKLCGGFYLVYLSYILNNNTFSLKLKNNKHFGFKVSLLTGLSNPEDIVFLLFFLPNFMVTYIKPSLQLLIISGIWIVIEVCIMLIYAEFSKRLINSKFMPKIMSILPAMVMFILGLAAIIISIYELIYH